MTIKIMCEHIAKADILKGNPTPYEIYNYSQFGELWRVFEWYEVACFKIGVPDVVKNLENDAFTRENTNE